MAARQFFYKAESTNPHRTLAAEEYMLTHIGPEDVILYLYAHDDSVIIGKNQNAWVECRHEQLERDGGRLARRISGGGAVFHDKGNLNFSFIASNSRYDLHRQLKVMRDAAQSFGIHAEFSGRNDIMADGRKFSGNAFCVRKNGSFQHGTILIDCDMNKMAKYLSVPKDKFESKGISSVRARVVNLRELNPEVTPDGMTAALKKAFAAEYGPAEDYPLTDEARAEIDRIAARNAGWDWIFGESPKFDVTIRVRFPWGGTEILLRTKDARVEDAKLYSDAMDADFMETIAPALTGCAFTSEALAARLRSLPHDEAQGQILSDLAGYLEEQGY